MDESLLARLRKACLHSRARFEKSDKVWCFYCRVPIDRIEFELHGFYFGPRTGEITEGIDYLGRPFKATALSDPDGDTPACPWCHSSTLLTKESIQEAGLTVEEKYRSKLAPEQVPYLLRQLKARYVRKTVDEGGVKTYEVLE